jgi:uroporphyrinogen decarboxylase
MDNFLMEPGFLKKEFGNDCTFWGGGIENVGVLNNGTPQQLRDQIFERLEIFYRGGGFVFNTVHNILPDVPPENIVAIHIENSSTLEHICHIMLLSA